MANNALLASDNFSSGSLAAGWVAVDGVSVCQVVNVPPHVTEANALSTSAGQIWTGLTWPNNHISEVTINLTQESGTTLYLIVREQGTGTLNGYYAQITNGLVNIIQYSNSTPTTIKSVTGLTFAAGDIWAFQAEGSVISLYQNFARIAYINDNTWTSGSPGYLQLSTVNLTHNRVFSWRGYNSVQQNGIWQKQGVILPALSGDLTSSGFGTANNTQIIHEGNAQVLSGTVYKMWISSGGTTVGGVAYAESLDGISWTRKSGLVLSNFAFPSIIKVGAVYYLYVQAISGLGTAPFSVYTSSDGITWTFQSGGVLTLGTAGQWDDGFIFFFTPVVVSGGTWTGMYSGGRAGGTGGLGLATSSDGITWTKYGGNPVLTGKGSGNAIVNANGVYYLWTEAAEVGAGGSGTGNPTDTVRYKSSDLINWSQSSPPAPWHAQIAEGVNTQVGQCVPNSIIDIGGKAYLYMTSVPQDNPGPSHYQISLAIAPAPIASIVTQNEDAVQQIATDPFTSGAGDLSANWTTPTGGTKLKIIAGPFVEPTVTSTICSAVYTGASFGAAQYSEVTLHALTGTLFQSAIAPTVMASTSAVTNYEATIGSPSGTADLAANINKRVAGTATQIGPVVQCEPQVGDVFRLSVFTGSDGFPILSLFQNGVLILQVQDQSSTPLTTGNPGMLAISVVAIADAQMSLWAGGNANVIPSFSSGTPLAGGDSADDEEDEGF